MLYIGKKLFFTWFTFFLNTELFKSLTLFIEESLLCDIFIADWLYISSLFWWSSTHPWLSISCISFRKFVHFIFTVGKSSLFESVDRIEIGFYTKLSKFNIFTRLLEVSEPSLAKLLFVVFCFFNFLKLEKSLWISAFGSKTRFVDSLNWLRFYNYLCYSTYT